MLSFGDDKINKVVNKQVVPDGKGQTISYEWVCTEVKFLLRRPTLPICVHAACEQLDRDRQGHGAVA